jgi:DNA (cytosine-5)-methyltransferase 1
MSAYYNEIDSFAAAWLRELIKAKLIADGEVDERSIELVSPDDLRGFRQCHFFAGIGGWSYALRLAGWPDDRECWTGSCPCQPFSIAGRVWAGNGSADPRHLWPAWRNLIRERQPPIIFGEQVASADGLGWLDLVCAELEAANYAFGAVDLCAAGVGAPINRPRLWFVACSVSGDDGREGFGLAAPSAGASEGLEAGREVAGIYHAAVGRGRWPADEPCPVPVVDGIPARVGRLRGYGNAIVPHVAAAFIAAVQDARIGLT